MDELNAHALRLLKFVEESVHEAIEDPESRAALLSEANCGVRVLRATLRRNATLSAEHEHTFARWEMLYNTNWDLEKIGVDNPDPKELLLQTLGTILVTRHFFGMPRPAA